MLWYKVWLETRTRFLISLAGITALCAYRIYAGNDIAASWADISYRYHLLHSGQQLLNVMWLVAITLLMMGGLIQEKANGSASFTLALPASRARMMNVRISAGLIQAALMIIVPWAAMYTVSYLSGPARSISQVLFYIAVLAGGGSVFVGVALLVSSLVEGTYTAPMISAGIVLACGNAPKSLSFLNPLNFMDGRDYLGPDSLAAGPFPWGHFAAYLSAAVLLTAASVKVVEKRDF